MDKREDADTEKIPPFHEDNLTRDLVSGRGYSSSVPDRESEEGRSGAVGLGVEPLGEDDRDGEAAVCGAPSAAKPLYDGGRFGRGVEADAPAVDADADETVQGAKLAPEGLLRCVDVAHAVTMVAPKRFRTAPIGFASVWVWSPAKSRPTGCDPGLSTTREPESPLSEKGP